MSELLEKILDDTNLKTAMQRVITNGGTFGIDKMEVSQLNTYFEEHQQSLKEQIRSRTYKPLPVKRVEIPKPNGGVRKLGIPTVIDRTIQQAIVQVLSPIFEPTFSEYSYGFRPNRCCQQAIVKALEYFNDGYKWIVDIDLEKFFDNVPQDKLMSYVHEVIKDGDVESLIRKYLQAGVMVNDEYEDTKVGTPQGGNLSPLLSNIMLTKLDKELEARGLRFTRYADDCIIIVKSHAAANRVMHTITSYIERKLGLKVNATKTKITTPNNLKYLGFGFYKDKEGYKAIPHNDSKMKFQRKIKKLCARSWSIDLTTRLKKLNEVIRGWINYFKDSSMSTFLTNLSSNLRTKIRIIIWKQWKTPQRREWGLKKLGIDKDRARQTSYMGDHYQFICTKLCVRDAISKKILIKRGLTDPYDYYLQQKDKVSKTERTA